MKGMGDSFSLLCSLKRVFMFCFWRESFTKPNHFEVPFEVFPEDTAANYLVFHDEFSSVH